MYLLNIWRRIIIVISCLIWVHLSGHMMVVCLAWVFSSCVSGTQTNTREEPSLAHNYSTIMAATRIKQTFKQEKRKPSNESHSTAKAACFSHYHEWSEMQRSLSAYFPLHFYNQVVALLTDNSLANNLKWVEEICRSQSDWLLGNLKAVHVKILSCHIQMKGRMKAMIIPLWL